MLTDARIKEILSKAEPLETETPANIKNLIRIGKTTNINNKSGNVIIIYGGTVITAVFIALLLFFW